MILTPEARRALQFMNNKAQLVTAEVLREARRDGSPLAPYFTPGCSRANVAEQLIGAFMRTRFTEHV